VKYQRRFGVPSADQDPTISRYEREDMAARDDIAALLGSVDGDSDPVGTVMGGNAGGNTLACLD